MTEKKEICELCNKEADTESTSMTGSYCIECLCLVRSECTEAIKILRARAKGKKITSSRVLSKEQYNSALNALIKGR